MDTGPSRGRASPVGKRVDWDNLAEEIADLGESVTRELRSRRAVLIAHLLKWIPQPERRSRSWSGTIDLQRVTIAEHMAESPSLAARDTRLDRSLFPDAPTFTPEQARDEAWWPNGDAPEQVFGRN